MSPRIGLTLPTLLQAAVEIADTQGISEVTLATLSKKLNIRTPSLYNHIDGLPGLRKLLSVHGLEMLRDRLAQALIERTGDDAVKALVAAYMAFARSHPGLYEATLRAPDPNDLEILQVAKEVTDLCLAAVSFYDLEDEAAIHTVRGLRSILHGFASLEQIGGFGLPYDLDTSIRMMINTFLAGIHTMRPVKYQQD